MSAISPTDFDSVEIQQQYNDINNRWELAAEAEWDNENSSARLFERSRIKALAGNDVCVRESEKESEVCLNMMQCVFASSRGKQWVRQQCRLTHTHAHTFR